MRAAPALCEADCTVRGRHAADCAAPDDADACRGCAPRQAADGLRLCPVHTERIAEDALEAPALWDDLGLVLIRRGRGGERTSGSSSGAPVPDDDVMDARAAIRSALIGLARTITVERGLRAPRRTRGARTYLDTRPATLGRLVARHAEWLAAHPDAGMHADLLHAVTRGRVRAMAYPAGSDRLYIGDCPLAVRTADGDEVVCGARLHQLPDQPLISCPGCGTDETIEQWQKWIVGETRGITDAYAVAAHLALRWMRPVDAGLIRLWAHRGHVTPVTAPDPAPADPDRTAVVRDGKGRTQYVIAEVAAYAEKLWGPPYRTKRSPG